MSKKTKGSKGKKPEKMPNGADMNSHQKKIEEFQLDVDPAKIETDLQIEEPNEIHSHSDGVTGPQPVEEIRVAAAQAAAEDPTRTPVEQRKDHKKRSRKKGRKNKWFFRGVWLAIIVLIGIGIAQFCITCLNDLLAFGKPSNEVTIELKKGATTEEVADILAENGLINNKWAFCTYSKMTKSDGHYEYGTFQLNTNMDYQGLINNLQESSNRVDVVKITFTEGMQVTEMAKKLEKAGVCTSDEFIEAVNNKALFEKFEFISDIKNKEGREYFLEGYLFPDTYEFYKNEGAQDALEKILNNTSNKLTAKLYKKAEKMHMTMDEVITMASMIQKEAADKKDMYNISSVFHNRLNSDSYMYLNSDPTIWYPYLTEKKMPEGYEGAYNTYTHPGLPIGPISNPGLSAIEAALDPADTNYYFFCHSKEGTPYYAETEEEHINNEYAAGLLP